MNKQDVVGRWPRDRALAVREIIRSVNLCSCGSDSQWECVLEILVEAEKHTENGFYRDKWFEFAAKVLDDRGLLEHGTTIGFAWLTDRGKLLLEFLREFGTESHDFCEHTGHPMWSVEYSWNASGGEPGCGDTYAEWQAEMLGGK